MTPPTGQRKGRILVVDDQRNMRTTTALLLRSEGYTVDEAGSGEEALAWLADHQVDLLLTDLKMEPMDGIALLKRAMEIAPRLAVMTNDLDRRRLLDAELRRLRWMVKSEIPRALRRMRASGQAGVKVGAGGTAE